jgi:hypothetical protein
VRIFSIAAHVLVSAGALLRAGRHRRLNQQVGLVMGLF